MISIIIPTYKRNIKMLQCCASILANSEKHIEIWILDQNKTSSKSLQTFERSHTSFIHYIKTGTRNKSKALNQAIVHALGDIIALTDDDCIVSPTWIHQIQDSFAKHPEISCVTGNTYPYRDIPSQACPPTINIGTKLFVTPQKHTAVGYGNNTAFRKSIFSSIGGFKTWLGPGSIGSNCEDGEILLRLLTRGGKILHNEQMIVYHNKNLKHTDYNKQQCSYMCGETACYIYYTLLGWKFARRVIQKNIIDSYQEIKQTISTMVNRKTIKGEYWIDTGQRVFSRLRGILIGIYYYSKENIFS